MQTINYYLIVSILILAFFQGLLEIYNVPTSIIFLYINIVMSIVVISSFFLFRQNYKVIGKWPFFLLLLIIVISYLLNSLSVLHLVFFTKLFFLPMVFFIALFNIRLSEEQRDKLIKWVIILFSIQIPASFVKIYLVGFREDYTGSISIEGGSISTILAVMAVSFVLSYSMIYKNGRILFLIPFFLLVAIASSKLGVFLYVFVVSIFLYILQNRLITLKTFIAVISIIFIAVASLYVFVIMTPRVNPDGIVGGRFDLQFALDWAKFYTSREKGAKPNMVGVARKDAPAAMYNIMENHGTKHIFVGFGPGDLIQSSYLPYDNPIVDKYNMGYGARIGLVWTAMQLGLLGALFYIWFHFLLLFRIYIKYKRSKTKKVRMFSLGMIGASLMFFIDFFSYSPTLINQPAMVLGYFIMIYYVLTLKNNENTFDKNERRTNVG